MAKRKLTAKSFNLVHKFSKIWSKIFMDNLLKFGLFSLSSCRRFKGQKNFRERKQHLHKELNQFTCEGSKIKESQIRKAENDVVLELGSGNQSVINSGMSKNPKSFPGNLQNSGFFSFLNCLKFIERKQQLHEDSAPIIDEKVEISKAEIEKVEKDEILEVGFGNGSVTSFAEARMPNQRLRKLIEERAKSKGEEEEEEEEDGKEKEMRLNASNEVLLRLKEIELKESCDWSQVMDIEDVLFHYSLVRNPSFVDLVNKFILDVTDGILN